MAGAFWQKSSAGRVASPLWRAVLQSADDFNVDTVTAQADRLLADSHLAWRERQVARMRSFSPDTVAGLVLSNPDTYDDCVRFIQGSRLLADSIGSGARDVGVVDDVYRSLVGLWDQSHQVRMLGAILLDVADAVGRSGGVERSLSITSGPVTTVMTSNRVGVTIPPAAAHREAR